MAEDLEAEYHLTCDNCGELFWSRDAFPSPQWCSLCKANPVRSKSVKARLKTQMSNPTPDLTEEPVIEGGLIKLHKLILQICRDKYAVPEMMAERITKEVDNLLLGYRSPSEVRAMIEQEKEKLRNTYVVEHIEAIERAAMERVFDGLKQYKCPEEWTAIQPTGTAYFISEAELEIFKSSLLAPPDKEKKR